jgi:hypothetical protein
VADTRACTKCLKHYPLTKEYWHRSKDGWHSKCRVCRNAGEKRGRDKIRHKKLGEIEKGAVDLFIASARIGGSHIPHSSELLETMMKYFGGVEGFSRAFIKQFFDAPAGGAFRTKQLDSILRLVVSNTAMGGSKKPLDLMTEEELEAQYRRDVLAAALAYQGQKIALEQKNALPEVPVVRPEPEHAGSGGVPPLPAADGRDAEGQG